MPFYRWVNLDPASRWGVDQSYLGGQYTHYRLAPSWADSGSMVQLDIQPIDPQGTSYMGLASLQKADQGQKH